MPSEPPLLEPDASTVTLQVAFLEESSEEVTVIVAVPDAFAVMRPEESTVATEVEELFQVTLELEAGAVVSTAFTS